MSEFTKRIMALDYLTVVLGRLQRDNEEPIPEKIEVLKTELVNGGLKNVESFVAMRGAPRELMPEKHHFQMVVDGFFKDYPAVKED